ncbi:hypothetical protein [Salinispora mooreana]|uniref:hypothetical protein n=1 Tax=Salinispora mooreana TaxID=999545 RepID=UPI0003795B5C|nr:hypothetical protein [Salinispora mooreana]
MISLVGHRYGTAAQIAHALGPDITAARVRDWARRSRDSGDRLHGLLPAHHLPGQGRGTTWYRYDQAAHVEMLTRTTGRGRTRVELTRAA